jgi:hypothetical protein
MEREGDGEGATRRPNNEQHINQLRKTQKSGRRKIAGAY